MTTYNNVEKNSLLTNTSDKGDKAWCSLVEGDEQLDRPNNQTIMESCHACVVDEWIRTAEVWIQRRLLSQLRHGLKGLDQVGTPVANVQS